MALEVDGEPWRTVPDEVVLRCGLAAGVELDRPLLRRLRAELRRAEAFGTAGRALRRRQLSEKRLRERLERAGSPPAARESALAALKSARLVDDARLAQGRARALAERGWGDAAIAARLGEEGIDDAHVHQALAALDPETQRAAALVAEIADRRKAWTLLRRRGFETDAIEEAIGPLDAEA